jgi:hypothetical protein
MSKRRRRGRALRRRYGHASKGYIETALNAAGRKGWVVQHKGGVKDEVLFVSSSRDQEIGRGKAEAAKRGIPFLMGV